MSVRTDLLGVSSIVRAVSLDDGRCYHRLLGNSPSEGIKVPLADGKKAAKSGKKMPGVKL